jgi:hypothetical protein
MRSGFLILFPVDVFTFCNLSINFAAIFIVFNLKTNTGNDCKRFFSCLEKTVSERT